MMWMYPTMGLQPSSWKPAPDSSLPHSAQLRSRPPHAAIISRSMASAIGRPDAAAEAVRRYGGTGITCSTSSSRAPGAESAGSTLRRMRVQSCANVWVGGRGNVGAKKGGEGQDPFVQRGSAHEGPCTPTCASTRRARMSKYVPPS